MGFVQEVMLRNALSALLRGEEEESLERSANANTNTKRDFPVGELWGALLTLKLRCIVYVLITYCILQIDHQKHFRNYNITPEE